MQWKRWLVMLVVLGMAGMVLNGCSNPEEKAAKDRLEQALALEQQKNLPEARKLLGELARKYPQTKAAGQGVAAQQRIIQQMDSIQRELSKTLESMVLVLAGYQSVTGKPLTDLGELDSGAYMFDSSYLAEAVPEGVEAYILLKKDGGFHLWAYRAEYKMGMQRDSIRRGGKPFAGEEMVQKLRSDYTTQKVAGKLNVLSPVVTAEK